MNSIDEILVAKVSMCPKCVSDMGAPNIAPGLDGGEIYQWECEECQTFWSMPKGAYIDFQ